MGFLTGRMTATRFKVSGGLPTMADGLTLLEKLADDAIGRQRIATADGSQVGWIAGDSILDTRFDLAKNVIADCLHFAIRLDTCKPPADLLKAYYQAELAALAAGNPSGLPSGRQKREARQVAKDRLEQEAKDGRFVKRRSVPLLWDWTTGELLVGTASMNVIDRVHVLFKQTFERTLDFMGAGRQAFRLAEIDGNTIAVDHALPSLFTRSQREEIAWTPDDANRDWLGNEFLLWLWYVLEQRSDTIKLADDSEVAVMFAKSITLECPRGQYGTDTFRSDCPTKIPEAYRALQAGRLPRKAGLVLHRHDSIYELSLQAETLAVGSAKFPTCEEESERGRAEERVAQVRHLLETLDLLYQRFLSVRFGDVWAVVAERMKKWLSRNADSEAA